MDAVDLSELRADEIEQLARKQLEGGFTTESDALTALQLIVALARRLQEIGAQP